MNAEATAWNAYLSNKSHETYKVWLTAWRNLAHCDRPLRFGKDGRSESGRA